MSGDFLTPPGWQPPAPSPWAPPPAWSPPPQPERSGSALVVALAIWIAAALLVGLGGALARNESDATRTAAPATTATTVPTRVAHSAPPSSSSDLTRDYADALVDASGLGYHEFVTPASGSLDADRFAQLAGPSMPNVDFAQALSVAGYRGGYLRVSRTADGQVVAEQFVFDFGSVSGKARDFADGLANGVARVASPGQPFDVPYDNGFGETLTVTDGNGTHPAAIVEYTLDGLIYVDFVLARSDANPVGADEALQLAQAQVDHG